LPEKMAFIRLASRAPGEAGRRQPPRTEAADGFLAALSVAGACCWCCFSAGATEAAPTPPEVRMGRRRRREYSISDDEK
jgi:hypothetical protein